MTYRDFWIFLSMVHFLLWTSVVAPVNDNFQENIALNKNALQSSNLIFPTGGHDIWSASNAVDGNKDCTVVDKDHYSGTDNELVPWWQVDLGNIYYLSTIIVYGRPVEDGVQLKGFQVYLLTSENSTDKEHIHNNTEYGNGVFSIPVQQNVFGRYVRIEMPGNYRDPPGRDGPLVLCEVEVYAIDIIQKLKDTLSPSMSSQSTYDGSNINWNASRAIDGVNNFLPNTCSCCSGTNGADVPWWKLRLPKPYIIAQVMIYGRSDSNNVQQSSNLFVYGSNNTSENGTQLYQGNPNRDSFVYSISLNPPRLFQILTIRRWITGLMTVCEVKLLQAGCPIGSFGDKCLGRCNCRDGVACGVNTGHCDSCPPGFKDDTCQTPCDDGKYGQNCSKSCGHCKPGNQQCNKTNGNCIQGCTDGFVGIRCEKACDNGTYGQNCSESCSGHCTNGNQQCKNTNGYCMQGCVDGYVGKKCENACLPSTYGHNCSKTCNACTQMECSNTDGLCSIGCVPGYKPTNRHCKEVCDDGQYGQNCSKSCIGHCKNGIHQCIKANGNCMQGCADGYIGDKCENKCPSSRFGENCTQICSNCEGLSCDNTDGMCLNGCVPGYTFDDPYCNTECPSSRFGENCTQICSNCEGLSCNNTDGMCLNGCVPGYTFDDPYCNTECPSPSFGENCIQICSNCEGLSCNNTNGMCLNGCVPGYTFNDSYCNTACPFSTYGLNCSRTCNTCADMSCNNTDGSCFNNCVPGYTFDDFYCNTTCPASTYGINCSQTCSTCEDMSCNNTDGLCFTGCVSGYTFEDSYCHTTCPASTYGKNCSRTCSTCEDMSCNNTDGWCLTGCVPGYTFEDSYCNTTCPASTYGINCSRTCHTCEEMSCYNTNGLCSTGCVPGYTFEDSYCRTTCRVGSYGRNCSSACSGNCLGGNENCDAINGTCMQECNSGFSGDRCELKLPMSSQSHSAAIGAGVGTTVALVIIGVVIGFIMYRRRNVKESSYKGNQFSNLDKALDSRKQRLSDRQGSSMLGRENSSFEGEEETAMTQSGSGDYYSFGGNFGGIKIYELWDCIKEKMENECDKFYSEFKKLPSGLVYPCTAADNLINKGKNRYKEMYAYDHTRVVLLDVEEGKNTDYINACYIDGYDKTQKFVASQGPTKQMINDFWRMVWQLKSDKIVMLTNLIEMGTVKCLQYWPLEDEEDEHCFGNVIVRVLKTETFLDYTMRLFEVRKNGESARKIRQYHFKSWPDKDVPDSTWCLVNFWRAVNTDEPSTAGPIVVHCSAGVGRTGTFIALDNLVAQAKAEGCVRPLQIVETLRRQRVNMVQTREQYVYLHEAVADALLFGTHFVFTKQFGEMFSFMLQKGKGETKCNLEKQFELIEKSARDMTSAGAAENVEYTNVETIQSESAAYRPKLKNRGSKFVQELGAMYIPNYKGKNTFLISMSPDKNTMEEFWSLVDDSHIKTVIMLTETSAACYQASCQLGANPKNGSKFSVNKIEEKIRKGFTERSFTFKESDREEEEYLTTVKQFEFTDWKDGSNVPGETRHMLEMINSVQKWQSHLSESQPILIHCSDGCKRSGIVCVLLNELQRILYEGGHINILESVKMMKKRQKYLIPTYEQYRFCFDLMLAHSKTTEVYENL